MTSPASRLHAAAQLVRPVPDPPWILLRISPSKVAELLAALFDDAHAAEQVSTDLRVLALADALLDGAP